MALYRFFFAPVLLAIAVVAGRVEKAHAPPPAAPPVAPVVRAVDPVPPRVAPVVRVAEPAREAAAAQQRRPVRSARTVPRAAR